VIGVFVPVVTADTRGRANRMVPRFEKNATILDFLSRRFDARRANQSMVKMDHVVGTYVPQETAHLIMLHHVPDRVRHGNEEHGGRAQEHAFNCNLVAKRWCVVQPL
jgi:hypothetical protein